MHPVSGGLPREGDQQIQQNQQINTPQQPLDNLLEIQAPVPATNSLQGPISNPRFPGINTMNCINLYVWLNLTFGNILQECIYCNTGIELNNLYHF